MLKYLFDEQPVKAVVGLTQTAVPKKHQDVLVDATTARLSRCHPGQACEPWARSGARNPWPLKSGISHGYPKFDCAPIKKITER